MSAESGTPTIHEQIIRCVEQTGHPDWSLREMVNRLKEIAKDSRKLERELATAGARGYLRGLEEAAKIAEEEWNIFIDMKAAHERLAATPFQPAAFGLNTATARRSRELAERIRARAAQGKG